MNSKTHYRTTIQIRVLASFLVKLAKQDREKRLRDAKTGVTLLQHNVIRLLNEKPCTITELADKLFIEPSSLMPIIDELERKNLLERTVDKKDRRRTPLVLNRNNAKRILAVPLLAKNSALVIALNHLGEKKSRHLLELLNEVVLSMTKNPELIEEISNLSS